MGSALAVRRNARRRAAGVVAVNMCRRSGPAAWRAEISISSPSTNCAPGPSVSSHAAQPREESSHGTGA